MQPILSFLRVGLVAALIALVSVSARAEQFVKYGDYEIHYNAFNSSFLQPDVAQSVGIVRGKRRALINVSVLKMQPDGSMKPVTAMVNGSVLNLIEQQQQMDFKKIDEGKAIYYIGSFGFTDDQLMRISLQVQPDANQPAFDINFEQKFYTD
ncbi:DUF4426 domain-containing protein [Marinobacterium arenosum]|uniref:DUF4426 domain-containing protein n=1 Tax=Marinobacterium arenosum TaxID=2862496 RepID=UPI001C9844CD|nr:DUF4426 domain-containing protein [Marinobacterium arenosum]MBY4676420.1 DUF4426 domain-containing protein [Marinobacterium arenosum]